MPNHIFGLFIFGRRPCLKTPCEVKNLIYKIDCIGYGYRVLGAAGPLEAVVVRRLQKRVSARPRERASPSCRALRSTRKRSCPACRSQPSRRPTRRKTPSDLFSALWGLTGNTSSTKAPVQLPMVGQSLPHPSPRPICIPLKASRHMME